MCGDVWYKRAYLWLLPWHTGCLSSALPSCRPSPQRPVREQQWLFGSSQQWESQSKFNRSAHSLWVKVSFVKLDERSGLLEAVQGYQANIQLYLDCVLFLRVEEELPQDQKAGVDRRTRRWSHHSLAVEVSSSSLSMFSSYLRAKGFYNDLPYAGHKKNGVESEHYSTGVYSRWIVFLSTASLWLLQSLRCSSVV